MHIDIYPWMRYRHKHLVNFSKILHQICFDVSDPLGFRARFPGANKVVWGSQTRKESIRKLVVRKVPYLLRFWGVLYPLLFLLLVVIQFPVLKVAFLCRCILKFCSHPSGAFVHSHYNNRGVSAFGRAVRYDDIFPLVKLEFDGCEYNAPRNHKKVLKRLYGNYELPPKYEFRVPVLYKSKIAEGTFVIILKVFNFCTMSSN